MNTKGFISNSTSTYFLNFVEKDLFSGFLRFIKNKITPEQHIFFSSVYYHCTCKNAHTCTLEFLQDV
jgi:hypothetical protein